MGIIPIEMEDSDEGILAALAANVVRRIYPRQADRRDFLEEFEPYVRRMKLRARLNQLQRSVDRNAEMEGRRLFLLQEQTEIMNDLEAVQAEISQREHRK